MIAQPASTTENRLEEELIALRSKLDEALCRITNLEALAAVDSDRPTLFPIDSPVILFARQLCDEIFPGPYTVEVACAPDEPTAQWYVFLVRCGADVQECVDRELQFGRRLAEAFPNEAADIRLSVLPI